MGVVVLPNKQSTDSTGFMEETAAEVMAVKPPAERKTHSYTLEEYEEIPVFIPVDITEDVVKLVTQKLLGSASPGDTDLEALQGWILKFGCHSKKLRISVEYFRAWMANQNPPWAAYRPFISGCLIALGNLPGLSPVSVGETCHQIFSMCVLKVTGPEANHACKDDQL